MIQKILESAEWTSANPTHINTLIQVNAVDNPDLEADVKALIEEGGDKKSSFKAPDEDVIKKDKQIKSVSDKIKVFDKGNVGEINRFTSEQFGNVRSLASNPSAFIFTTFLRKFAKGAGVVALALLIFEAVKFVINELMKPGRFLDRRFRRNIENEILAFRSREEKQKLNQGLSSVIVTTIGGLRGGQGQTFYTLATVLRGESLFQKNFLQPNTEAVAAGLPFSKNKKPKSVFQ